MAKIDQQDAESSSPQVASLPDVHVNPAAASQVSEAVTEGVTSLGGKLIQLKNAQDVTNGSMAIEQTLNQTQKQVMESSDYKTYAQTMDGAVATLTDSINKNYDGPAKTELLNRLAAQKIQRDAQLDTWAYNGTVATAKQNMADAGQESLKNIAYGTGMERQFYKSQYLQDIDSHTGTIYTPEDALALKRSFSEAADYGSATTDVTRDPNAALKKLADPSNYSDITPEQRSGLTEDATREAKQRQILAETGLASRTDSALSEAAITGKWDPSLDAAWNATGDKDKIAAVAESRNTALLYHTIAMQMMNAPLDKLDAIVEGFSPGGVDQITGKARASAPSYAMNGIRSFDNQQKLYGDLQNLSANIKATASKDAPALTWQTASQGLDPTKSTDEIIDRSDKALADRGITRRDPLPSSVADQYANNLNGMNANERMMALTSLQISAPKHFDEIMRQLSSKLPPSTVFYNSVSPDTMKSAMANDAMSIDKFKDAVGPDKFKLLDSEASSQFRTVARTLPGNPSQTSSVYQTFLKMSASNQMAGVTDPVGSAYKSLFGSYDFRDTWRIPKGVDYDTLNQYGQKVIADTKTFVGSQDSENLRASLAATNNWVFQEGASTSAGSYYLRDANGQQVYTRDDKGKNVPVSFTIGKAMSAKFMFDTAPTPGATPGQLRNVNSPYVP